MWLNSVHSHSNINFNLNGIKYSDDSRLDCQLVEVKCSSTTCNIKYYNQSSSLLSSMTGVLIAE
jgi:hypothetical protein